MINKIQNPSFNSFGSYTKSKKHQGKTTTRQETLDGKTWEVAAGEGNYIQPPLEDFIRSL
jgi:hypothetical protein